MMFFVLFFVVGMEIRREVHHGELSEWRRAALPAAAALGGMHTIGLLGGNGGPLRERCHQALVVPSATTARIQEAHIFIGHNLCALIEEALGLR